METINAMPREDVLPIHVLDDLRMCQQQDRRQLLTQAREVKRLTEQLTQARQEARHAAEEHRLAHQQMASDLEALNIQMRSVEDARNHLQETLQIILQSRGYRLIRIYAAFYNIPVLGSALRRFRQITHRFSPRAPH